MTLKSRYINNDNFREYTGRDLEQEYQQAGETNPSLAVERFIARVELRLVAYINKMFNKQIDSEWFCWSEKQKLNFKYALCEQIEYMLINGDIALDSGYDRKEGAKIGRAHLNEITLCEPCLTFLHNVGLTYRGIKPRTALGLNYGEWINL